MSRKPAPGRSAIPSAPDALVTLKNLGINGQIAINANGGEGEWLGVIRVAQGGNPITGPFFVMDEADHNLSPSVLGSGVAGLQSYEVWGAASDPMPGSIRFRGSIDPNSIEVDPPCIDDLTEMYVSFYGKIDRVESDAIRLYKRGVLGTYVLMTNVVVTDLARGFRLKRSDNGVWETGSYKVEVVSGAIRVDNSDVLAGGTQLFIPETEYTFSVVKGCQEMDLDGDGLLCASDIAEWFNSAVNLNNYPTVDNDDLLTLIRGVNDHAD